MAWFESDGCQVHGTYSLGLSCHCLLENHFHSPANLTLKNIVSFFLISDSDPFLFLVTFGQIKNENIVQFLHPRMKKDIYIYKSIGFPSSTPGVT